MFSITDIWSGGQYQWFVLDISKESLLMGQHLICVLPKHKVASPIDFERIKSIKARCHELTKERWTCQHFMEEFVR